MKQIFFILTVGVWAFWSACTPANNPASTSSNPQPAAGVWKITYFFDKQEETANYLSYTFEFGNNGVLTAKNGTQTWTGVWSNNCDDSANKFCITFAGSAPSALEELSEDWLVIKMEDQLMHLEHVSGGNGDTDIVHFEK